MNTTLQALRRSRLLEIHAREFTILVKVLPKVEIEAEGLSVVGIFRTFAVVIGTYTKPSWLATLFRWTLVPISNLSAVAVARVVHTKNDQFSANFAACAQK
jgi:hypothetical protein